MRSALLLFLCAFVYLWLSQDAHADVSLPFNKAIELPQALACTGCVLNATFSSAVSELLNSALEPTLPVKAQSYAVGNDIVVVASSWATGSEASVSDSISSLGETFNSASTNTAFLAGINQLTVAEMGRQPTNVVMSDACEFTDVVNPQSPTACLRNLTVAFLVTPSVSVRAGDLQSTLCRMLDTDCGLISFDGTVDTTIINTGSSSGVVFRQSTFTVQAEDRDTAFVTIVSYANSASLLSSFNLTYIVVNGVTVYYQGDEPVLTVTGEIGQCVSSYWYLIFLIILVPVIVIVSQRMYFWGRTSGKRSVAKSERDIRAGVHLSQAWSGPGGAGMMGLGMMNNGMMGGGVPQPGGWYAPQQTPSFQAYNDNQQMFAPQFRSQAPRQQTPSAVQQQNQWMPQPSSQQQWMQQQQQLSQPQWMQQQQQQQQGWGYTQ